MKLRYGQAAPNVLDRSVYKRLGSVGGCYSRPALSAVSVSSRNWICREAGFLGVVGAVNRLAAEGKRALYVQTVVLLPPDTQEQTLRDLEDQIRAAALMNHVMITGGHTEVTSAVTRPVIMAAAEGVSLPWAVPEYQEPEYQNNRAESRMAGSRKPEQKALTSRQTSQHRERGTGRWHIIMTGFAGMEGTYLLAQEKNDLLRKRFSERFLDRARKLRLHLSVGEAAAQIIEAAGAIPVMISAGEGGIAAALWNFSEETGRKLGLHGFDIALLDIPIRQETVEITDYFGINPYEMAAEGSLLAAVQEPSAVLTALEEHDIAACDIGVLTDSNDKRLHNAEEIRFLDAPAPDALLSLLG